MPTQKNAPISRDLEQIAFRRRIARARCRVPRRRKSVLKRRYLLLRSQDRRRNFIPTRRDEHRLRVRWSLRCKWTQGAAGYSEESWHHLDPRISIKLRWICWIRLNSCQPNDKGR